MRHTPGMLKPVYRYHRHRFPAEIISHCVWQYFRFPLSFRDVEEMLAMRLGCFWRCGQIGFVNHRIDLLR